MVGVLLTTASVLLALLPLSLILLVVVAFRGFVGVEFGGYGPVTPGGTATTDDAADESVVRIGLCDIAVFLTVGWFVVRALLSSPRTDPAGRLSWVYFVVCVYASILAVYFLGRAVVVYAFGKDVPVSRAILSYMDRYLHSADVYPEERLDEFDVKTEYHEKEGELEVSVESREDSRYGAGAVEVLVNGEVRQVFSCGEWGSGVRIGVNDDDDVSIRKYS